MTEHPRLHSLDVLVQMKSELCIVGANLVPYDGDQRETWLAACRQLLAAVPDHYQRIAWQMQLAMAFGLSMPGVSIEIVMVALEVKEHHGGENDFFFW